jgi:hypothetical protein
MNPVKKAAALALTAGALALAAGGFASPVGAVAPHQHYLETPGTTTNIANGFCNGDFSVGNPQNKALEHFHENIHTGDLGPEANANPEVGLDLISSGCTT